jgi:glucose-6-phosphate dehydrogenase assembly protein OpcA
VEAAVTVAPEKILKELAALWVQQGAEQGKEGGAGVLRACSMTLVVVAEESEEPAALGETIASLMPEHPARAILIRLRGAGERALSERVYQQCWKPFGQRQQICCEQIELTASDAALGDLPSVLLPLVVSDLPVILWCRSPRLTQLAEFYDIARVASKVVADSAAFANATDAIVQLADAQRRGLVMGDLAWTRGTRWRETLARVFENREYLARLHEISDVKVWFGRGFETAAWYLGAWAWNALADAAVTANLSVERGAQTLAMELTGPAFRVALGCEGGTLGVNVGKLADSTHLPRTFDSRLMREELRVVRRDTLFERTLSAAARLAVSSS